MRPALMTANKTPLNETCVMYLKRLWYSGNKKFGFHECELEIQKYKNIKTDTLCATLDYTKNSQSLARIQTRTRSQRFCGGVHRRCLAQTLQPSSQCPMGADRSHTFPDVVTTSSWCECARDDRQVSERP
jgi:hypothetical protein